MSKFRFMLLSSMLGGALLLTGCRTLANSCLPPPDAENSVEGTPLRTPVGLDAADTREALKVPPLEDPVVAPSTGRCLEFPPQLAPLPDPGLTAKQMKKEAKQAAKAARAAEKAAKKKK